MHHGRRHAAAAALAACIVAACSDTAGTGPLAAQVATRAAAAPGVDAGAVGSPAALRTEAPAADVAAALAALPAERVATGDDAVRRFLRTHFEGTCHADDRFAFDEVCEHAGRDTGRDPSPWPSMMIGLRDGGIASAVLIDAPRPLPGWACDPVPGFDPMLACVPPSVAAADRMRWAGQWAAFFRTAD